MKAHVKSKREIEKALEMSEILRINKIWLYAIGENVRISKERLRSLYAAVCEVAGKLYEDPELWLRVDDYIFDSLGFEEGVFYREDYDEREKLSAEIHKANGKKWRCY